MSFERGAKHTLSLFVAAFVVGCGGGGSSGTPPQGAVNKQPTALTASFANTSAGWVQGQPYRERVVGVPSDLPVSYEVKYGPAGLTVSQDGEISWDGKPLDLGTDYQMFYDILVKSATQTLELKKEINIASTTTPIATTLSFQQEILNSFSIHSEKSRAIKQTNGRELLAASLSQGKYIVASLNGTELSVASTALRREGYNDELMAVGKITSDDRMDELYRRKDTAQFYLSSAPQQTIEIPGAASVGYATLLDVTGDGLDEILLTHVVLSGQTETNQLLYVFNTAGSLLYSFTIDDDYPPYDACDTDGDGINELMTKMFLFNPVTTARTYVLGYESFIVNAIDTSECDSFLKLSALGSGTIEWLRTSSTDIQQIDISGIFHGEGFGENAKLVENRNADSAHVLIFDESNYGSELINGVLSLDKKNSKLTKSPVTFKTSLGITLAASDFVVGVADFDGNGDEEYLIKHILQPGDAQYRAALATTSSEYNEPAHVLVATSVTNNELVPAYISDVLVGGNTGYSASLLSGDKVAINQGARSLIMNRDRTFTIPAESADSGARYILSNGDVLLLSKTTGLRLLSSTGELKWDIAATSIGLHTDSPSEEWMGVEEMSTAPLALITISPASTTRHVINLINGSILESMRANIFTAPDFKNSGLYFRSKTSLDFEGIFRVTASGIQNVYDWTKLNFASFSSPIKWINADGDEAYELLINKSVYELTGTLSSAKLYDTNIYRYCLAWDRDCRQVFSQEKDALTLVDRVTGNVTLRAPGVKLRPYSSVSSYHDGNSKHVIFVSDEIQWY